MVNKQYNIQNVKKSKNRSPPPNRNLSVISNVPNPSTTATTISGSLDSISEENNFRQNIKNELDKNNITYLHNNTTSVSDDFGISDDNTSNNNCDRLATTSIHDIGRFQYILQMDRELEREAAERYYKMSNSQSPQFSPYSTANSINSNNHHINFWKIGSQSPITSYSASSSTTSSRSQQYRHHLHSYTKLFWKFSKWPLTLLIVCGIVAMLIYFLFIETKLTESLSQNQLVLNSFSNQNHDTNIDDDRMQTISFNIVETSSILQHGGRDIDQTERNWNYPLSTNRPEIFVQQQHENSPTDNNHFTNQQRDSITGRLAVFLQNPLVDSNHYDERDERTNPNILFENITQKVVNHQDSLTLVTKPPKRENFSRNTQILEISTPKLMPIDDLLETPEDFNKKLLFPTKETLEFFGFTSGHQNNFGIPIEEDERMLRMLNEEIIRNEKKRNHSADYYPTTTDGNSYRTRVSPTLPILQTIDVTTEHLKNVNNFTQLDDEICQSTSLPMCRSVLPYDLTLLKRRTDYTPLELQHFEYLVTSKCSMRSHEFLCSVLEPECRPKIMGALLPCKRVCKSILEPCGHIIAASEILTLSFDCDSYPDSNDPSVCRDITKNKKCFKNEFQCNDLTCIPLQWKCDNIKDCSAAEDEENCTFCEQDEFRCFNTDKCIPDKWRCDQYEDCPGGSDEMDCFDDDANTYSSINISNDKLFQYSPEQIQNQPISRPYLTISGDDRINSADVTERKRPIYTTDIAESTDYSTISDVTSKVNTNKDDSDDFHSAASGITVPISKSLANFQDSKEIMMTSDSEADYKYSSSNIVQSKTAHQSPCPEGELRCVNGLCITISQLCDKVTDCPDGADEAMCVFKN